MAKKKVESKFDKKVFQDMTERFEFPTYEEYDNLYVFINNNEQGWIQKPDTL